MHRYAAALAAGLFALSAFAQDQTKPVVKEEISFKTFDGVLIKGTFYPKQAGGGAGPPPVVMLLHKMGGKRTDEGWEGLAGRLQQKGYAVLSFDFRGHGDSKIIENPTTFWGMAHNQRYLTKPDPLGKKTKLDFQEFTIGYLPYLVNDIAAARHDLDNRNDSGQVNTSNIIIIGAEEGATLGFFWWLTEYYRPQVYKENNLLNFGSVVINNNPAGEDIAGAIWLSFKKNPGFGPTGRHLVFPYSQWAGTITVIREKIPMWFAAGAKDPTGIADAKFIYNDVLHAEKKPKLDLTFNLPVAGTNLRGVSLLGREELKTDELIDKFIDKAVKKRGGTQSAKRRNAGDFKPAWIDPATCGFGR